MPESRRTLAASRRQPIASPPAQKPSPNTPRQPGPSQQSDARTLSQQLDNEERELKELLRQSLQRRQRIQHLKQQIVDATRDAAASPAAGIAPAAPAPAIPAPAAMMVDVCELPEIEIPLLKVLERRALRDFQYDCENMFRLARVFFTTETNRVNIGISGLKKRARRHWIYFIKK